ncbi:5-oxoprolinase subunit PxpA [Thalassococcus sp. S3]|uniref:5-oxoprolinase subunit PxpA n=1 Tax=Thalassococcus sp. S3 TaxID=2017482 RepID=UPI0010246B1A|nr:5-oxoprolinase subunit PxpA [Thalassococcus sp. S3]QBF30518.1 lactam utilization protein LamB [Thalassococcus sp. S3]
MADLNCDMGESFGLYHMGNDAALMPYIDQANVACGFHASDPNHMRKTVELAVTHDVRIGAHVSLPDLPGFGRREMKIDEEEMLNIVLYQIGALNAFCKQAGTTLAHIKPHGALYGMAARQDHIARAIAAASRLYDLPVMGLAGTLHETIYQAEGAGFIAEFFADLDYDDTGKLIITRAHDAVDPAVAAERVHRAVADGTMETVGGQSLPVRAETICIHSDTPNSEDIAKAASAALAQLKAA